MKYLIQATGCRKGAIGQRYPLAVIIEADSAEAAHIKAYDHVEHLTMVRVEPYPPASLDGFRELVHADR